MHTLERKFSQRADVFDDRSGGGAADLQQFGVTLFRDDEGIAAAANDFVVRERWFTDQECWI